MENVFTAEVFEISLKRDLVDDELNRALSANIQNLNVADFFACMNNFEQLYYSLCYKKKQEGKSNSSYSVSSGSAHPLADMQHSLLEITLIWQQIVFCNYSVMKNTIAECRYAPCVDTTI